MSRTDYGAAMDDYMKLTINQSGLPDVAQCALYYKVETSSTKKPAIALARAGRVVGQEFSNQLYAI